MAKRKVGKQMTPDEAVEQATWEANVVAEEQAEAAATADMQASPATEEVAEVPPPINPQAPSPEDEPPPTRYTPTYSPYGEAQYIADKKSDKELFAMINGVRYEHVSEAPDGRWVYGKS